MSDAWPWQILSTREVYANPWMRVREDQVITPGGEPGIYGVMSLRHPAVFVVPLTTDDEVLLVSQYRYPQRQLSWEIPSGGSDGEDPLAAAQRELLEETGYQAMTWTRLAGVGSLNGLCDAPGEVFLARGLTRVADAGALPEEGIVDIALVPWRELVDRVRRGAITDSESLAAILLAAIALGRLS